jgi:hypothetical protein
MEDNAQFNYHVIEANTRPLDIPDLLPKSECSA